MLAADRGQGLGNRRIRGMHAIPGYQEIHSVYGGDGDGVCGAEVRVEAIRPQNRSNPSVPVRKTPRAFVGQVFNLRPVSNRPPASARQRRRLET